MAERLWPKAVPLGQRGELAAARFLRSSGYKVVAGGFRRRFGEIDLVAIDDQTLVFVEVKTRASAAAGQPVETVDHRKQQRLVQTALAFMKRRRLLECRARFDIIGIVWPDPSESPRLMHYPSAFESSSFGQFYS